MNIAEPLKKMMEQKGISRSKLGREIGVHTSTVSNWLDGKDVKLENLAILCSYFDCSMDDFVGEEAMELVPPERSTRGMTPEEREAYYRGQYLDEKKEKPTPVSESGRPVNIVKIAGRDGSYAEKRLTDEQVKALQTIIDQMPEAPDDL